MEAAGIYQSAQLFFEQHQMLFLKLFTDQPDEDGFDGGNKKYSPCQMVYLTWQSG